MKTHVFRLTPGEDLLESIVEYCRERNLKAAIVLTCVGSLRMAAIRLADQKEVTLFKGKFEIVCLTGTLSPDGAHLHIAISDHTGRTLGGHLMPGSLIYTTAEIALGELEELRFTRPLDEQTGYDELKIELR